MVDQAKDVFEGTSNEVKDLLTELVGEGKKFKTTEDLARGKLEADKHIAQIELENRGLKEKLASAKSVEDILEAVKANAVVEQNHSNNSDNTDLGTAPKVVSAEQIAQIVAEQLTGRETARTKELNRKKANDLLVSMFGEKAGEVFNTEAATPELRATLTSLAEVSPEKFAQFFKRENKESVVDNGDKSLNVNVQNMSKGSIEPGTQAYYSEMRKKTPKLYYSPAIQLEMHAAALKDSAKYFGRSN